MHTRSQSSNKHHRLASANETLPMRPRQCLARQLERQEEYACTYGVHVLESILVTLDVSQEDKSPLKDEA